LVNNHNNIYQNSIQHKKTANINFILSNFCTYRKESHKENVGIPIFLPFFSMHHIFFIPSCVYKDPVFMMLPFEKLGSEKFNRK